MAALGYIATFAYENMRSRVEDFQYNDACKLLTINVSGPICLMMAVLMNISKWVHNMLVIKTHVTIRRFEIVVKTYEEREGMTPISMGEIVT